MTETDGIIDQYVEEVNKSQSADYDIWKNTEDVKTAEDYSDTVKNLKEWIKARRIWADDHIDEVGQVYFAVSYVAEGQVVATEQVRYGEKLSWTLMPQRQKGRSSNAG